MKKQVYGHLDRGAAEALEESNRLMLESFGRPDFGEGVASFVEGRPPQFEGVELLSDGFEVRPVAASETRQLRQEVLRPHQTLEDLAAHEIDDAFAVGAFEGERLVAVGFVAPDGGPGAWRVRGMATAPEARGRGAGRAVLDALVEHALEQDATRVWCNARVPAKSLYERAGFRVTSDVFELPDIGPHVVMERHFGGSERA